MKILLVDGHQRTAEQVAKVLTDQHYVVDVATNAQMGWELVETFSYDLLLLAVMLPKLDGISLCRRLRQEHYQMPTLLLTDQTTTTNKVIGLDAGADDLLVKPFEFQELLARIRALLRRSSYTLLPVLEWGSIRLDSNNYCTTYENQTLQLTPKEYRLLELFLRYNSRVLTPSMILEHLWSFDDPPGENAVKAHVKRLRNKLKAAGAPSDFIRTVYGLGYHLKSI